MYRRLTRRLLDPVPLSLAALALQALLWWLWMPEVPRIFGAAPRFVSGDSLWRYALFLAFYMVGLAVGKALTRRALGRWRDHTPRLPLDLRYMERVARIALALTVVGELVYIRELILNAGPLIEAVRNGSFASLGEEVRSMRLVGISSLNNLFVIPTAVYALLACSPDHAPAKRVRARLWLIGIGAAILLHAILFVGRTLFVSYLLIILAAYIMQTPTVHRPLGRVLVAAGLMLIVIWFGEVLRGGLYFARFYDLPLFSRETQEYVLHRLVEGYFAADLNNAMALLSCPPPLQYVSTTMWATVATPFGVEFEGYSSCSLWLSQFGTATIFALLWWDLGWLGLVPAFLLGAWLGLLYVRATDTRARSEFSAMFYLIAYPGILSLLRINYFAETIYVLPTCFLAVAWLLRPKERVGPVLAHSGLPVARGAGRPILPQLHPSVVRPPGEG